MDKISSLKKWIPNAITCSRLLFLGAIIWLLINNNLQFIVKGHIVTNLHLVLALYFFGAMTDVIDGPLARRWNVQSTVGNILDHAIDKIFILPVIFYLIPKYLMGGLFWGILGLELIVAYISLNLLFRHQLKAEIKEWPNRWGKISYVFLIVAVCITCLAVKWQTYWHSFSYAANGALGISILLRIASLIKYFKRA